MDEQSQFSKDIAAYCKEIEPWCLEQIQKIMAEQRIHLPDGFGTCRFVPDDEGKK